MEIFVLILFFILMIIFLKNILSGMLHLNAREQNSLSILIFKAIFSPFKYVIGQVFGVYSKEGFMSYFDKKDIFSRRNKGFVIDGENLRLSRESSFKNVLVTGAAGLGKTSAYIYTNIFNLANNKQKNSLIIADPKSEFIAKTSGYLKNKGYEVYSLNPLDLSKGISYNPLINCKSDQDIDEVARIIISSASPGHVRAEDKFWLNGGVKLIFIICHCLINTKQVEIINLPNVLHCLNNFGDKGIGIDKFISQFASSKTYSMWTGLLNSNENVLLSFLSTAQNALMSISINNNIEQILINNSLSFKDLRNRKIALFINIPPQYEEQMSFLTNLFYTQVFNSLTPIPSRKENDIFALLDEVGQYKISKLPVYTTFLRASRVGFLMLIQDFNQLIDKYGKQNASVIADGGVSTSIYFSNTGIETATTLEKKIGSKRIYQQNGSFVKDQIMPINKIITMKNNEVLLFHSTKKPIKFTVKRYFEIRKFRRYTRSKQFISSSNSNHINVQYINLGAL